MPHNFCCGSPQIGRHIPIRIQFNRASSVLRSRGIFARPVPRYMRLKCRGYDARRSVIAGIFAQTGTTFIMNAVLSEPLFPADAAADHGSRHEQRESAPCFNSINHLMTNCTITGFRRQTLRRGKRASSASVSASGSAPEIESVAARLAAAAQDASFMPSASGIPVRKE